MKLTLFFSPLAAVSPNHFAALQTSLVRVLKVCSEGNISVPKCIMDLVSGWSALLSCSEFVLFLWSQRYHFSSNWDIFGHYVFNFLCTSSHSLSSWPPITHMLDPLIFTLRTELLCSFFYFKLSQFFKLDNLLWSVWCSPIILPSPTYC